MRYITLRLNERLNKVPLFADVESILDNLYVNNKSNMSTYKSYYLEDSYKTFYELSKLIKHSYTDQELITIANYIYHLKGSIISVDEFCRLFNINIYLNYQDFDLKIEITLGNLHIDDQISFSYYIKKLINELLFSLSSKIDILDIHFNIKIINNIEQAVTTKLINNIDTTYQYSLT